MIAPPGHKEVLCVWPIVPCPSRRPTWSVCLVFCPGPSYCHYYYFLPIDSFLQDQDKGAIEEENPRRGVGAKS